MSDMAMTHEFYLLDVFQTLVDVQYLANFWSTLPKKFRFLLYFIFISATNFTFIVCVFLSFVCVFLHLNFLSSKLTATGDKPFHLLAMEQNLDHDNSMQKNFSERFANVNKVKSNKCNLCDYVSSHAGHLRRHLKMHSGGK